jgi:hypothetical protein
MEAAEICDKHHADEQVNGDGQHCIAVTADAKLIDVNEGEQPLVHPLGQTPGEYTASVAKFGG